MTDTTTDRWDPNDWARRSVEQEVAERVARDHAAADLAHRDDLARDVARLWPAFQRTRMNNPEATAESIKVWDELMAAFDRLAAVYGEET